MVLVMLTPPNVVSPGTGLLLPAYDCNVWVFTYPPTGMEDLHLTLALIG